MAKLGSMTSTSSDFSSLVNKYKRASERVEKICIDGVRAGVADFIYEAQRITPVDTGKLRKGWTGGEELAPSIFSDSISVKKKGIFGSKTYVARVVNKVEYAIYVEYGHYMPDKVTYIEPVYMNIRSADYARVRISKHLKDISDKEMRGIFG